MQDNDIRLRRVPDFTQSLRILNWHTATKPSVECPTTAQESKEHFSRVKQWNDFWKGSCGDDGG